MTKYRLIIKILLIYSVFVVSNQPAFAQTLNDSVAVKMYQYQQSHPSTLLFTHFDKTIYTNNENVWFTAYLLNCVKPELHHTLAVALVNDLDKTVVL